MRYLNMLLLAAVMLAMQGCASSIIGSSSEDRRSAGTRLEDEQIESKAMARILDKYKGTAQVSVTSYNHFVLISGEALSEATKTEIERIVRSVINVKKTANEINVGALSNASSRRADSRITSNIEAKLKKNISIPAKSVHVNTERGVVYLFGLSTHAEANAAAEIASTTADVLKVVRVFEYID